MSMEAGRELDALIAEKVMGWRRFEGSILGYWGDGFQKIPRDALPAYSSSISAAWTVVERLKEAMIHIQLHSIPGGWSARVFRVPAGLSAEVIADTPALAIALAALKAVGHET